MAKTSFSIVRESVRVGVVNTDTMAVYFDAVANADKAEAVCEFIKEYENGVKKQYAFDLIEEEGCKRIMAIIRARTDYADILKATHNLLEMWCPVDKITDRAIKNGNGAIATTLDGQLFERRVTDLTSHTNLLALLSGWEKYSLAMQGLLSRSLKSKKRTQKDIKAYFAERMANANESDVISLYMDMQAVLKGANTDYDKAIEEWKENQK